uniref:OSJNBa0087H01.8 protein n=1 Tax=Oryza sativa subsp. japonica TaxID=39947 RepID=Q7XW21_ORYSJ|nr:OSJNBa0087H01.8 [Oryza sativa Japonica Group]
MATARGARGATGDATATRRGSGGAQLEAAMGRDTGLGVDVTSTKSGTYGYQTDLGTWYLQDKVLEHDAVGVFLTHSGWNSTLESPASGVLMLSWLFFAEQQTNCRYKQTEWGVAMEIGGEAWRGEVAAMTLEAMEGEKGREMRQRAEEWKQKAVQVTLLGGPWDTNLDRVIHEVLLSCKDKTLSVNASASAQILALYELQKQQHKFLEQQHNFQMPQNFQKQQHQSSAVAISFQQQQQQQILANSTIKAGSLIFPLATPGAEDEDATQDIPALCQSTMTNCLGHLLALLARLKEWKEKAVRVTMPSGPGDTNLDRIIHEVLLSCKGENGSGSVGSHPSHS